MRAKAVAGRVRGPGPRTKTAALRGPGSREKTAALRGPGSREKTAALRGPGLEGEDQTAPEAGQDPVSAEQEPEPVGQGWAGSPTEEDQ
ncbi:hypothetical protein CesoFtcFv8_024547 [Champsocephalus esox]|uniref:Uncharacterized protein n=1 Tax=Champsocephalus esox TaxID=159716 RepID=A0AAN8B6X0_9TELE|nr:hypothetical protein CesoFtcFv8_024547 [Champsocephalus esox]